MPDPEALPISGPLPVESSATVSTSSNSWSSSAARNAPPHNVKVTSILSSSYTDGEFRDTLTLLDARGVTNNPETRRRLRLDMQKQVIDSNGEIVNEFGRVAEVSIIAYVKIVLIIDALKATETHQSYSAQAQL